MDCLNNASDEFKERPSIPTFHLHMRLYVAVDFFGSPSRSSELAYGILQLDHRLARLSLVFS